MSKVGKRPIDQELVGRLEDSLNEVAALAYLCQRSFLNPPPNDPMRVGDAMYIANGVIVRIAEQAALDAGTVWGRATRGKSDAS